MSLSSDAFVNKKSCEGQTTLNKKSVILVDGYPRMWAVACWFSFVDAQDLDLAATIILRLLDMLTCLTCHSRYKIYTASLFVAFEIGEEDAIARRARCVGAYHVASGQKYAGTGNLCMRPNTRL